MIITYPNFNPIIVEFMSLKITWYGMSYVVSIILSLLYIKKLDYENKISKELLDDLFLYVVICMIVGGRLGYVIFYGLDSMRSFMDVIATWRGGMSFHGGLVGVIVGTYIVARKHKFSFLKLADYLSIAVPIGLFLGRVANFINGELWGRRTGGEYGMIFPHVDFHPRHPSQLYEALFEGIIFFAVMNILFYRSEFRRMEGKLAGFFLIYYGVVRVVLENFREPDVQLGFLFNILTMGQLLSIPMIIFGLYLYSSAKKN